VFFIIRKQREREGYWFPQEFMLSQKKERKRIRADEFTKLKKKKSCGLNSYHSLKKKSKILGRTQLFFGVFNLWFQGDFFLLTQEFVFVDTGSIFFTLMGVFLLI